MKGRTANADFERFLTGAAKYAAYLETPEGRLRLDLAFANLQEFLPPDTHSLRALDLGCGTGAIGIRLARLGFHVTLLDPSLPMLDFAQARRPGSRGYGQDRTDTRRRLAIGSVISRCIVRSDCLPQRSGICRGPMCCVARCGSRLARFLRHDLGLGA